MVDSSHVSGRLYAEVRQMLGKHPKASTSRGSKGLQKGCRQGLQARGCRQRAADKQLQARLEDLRAALDAGSCGEKVPGLAYPTIGPPNLTTIESNRSITFAIQILSFP